MRRETHSALLGLGIMKGCYLEINNRCHALLPQHLEQHHTSALNHCGAGFTHRDEAGSDGMHHVRELRAECSSRCTLRPERCRRSLILRCYLPANSQAQCHGCALAQHFFPVHVPAWRPASGGKTSRCIARACLLEGCGRRGEGSWSGRKLDGWVAGFEPGRECAR